MKNDARVRRETLSNIVVGTLLFPFPKRAKLFWWKSSNEEKIKCLKLLELLVRFSAILQLRSPSRANTDYFKKKLDL